MIQGGKFATSIQSGNSVYRPSEVSKHSNIAIVQCNYKFGGWFIDEISPRDGDIDSCGCVNATFPT